MTLTINFINLHPYDVLLSFFKYDVYSKSLLKIVYKNLELRNLFYFNKTYTHKPTIVNGCFYTEYCGQSKLTETM